MRRVVIPELLETDSGSSRVAGVERLLQRLYNKQLLEEELAEVSEPGHQKVDMLDSSPRNSRFALPPDLYVC
jgi:hypothetical protein